MSETVMLLKAKNFVTADDLRLLSEADIAKLKIPMRDANVILLRFGKNPDPSSILKVESSKNVQQPFNARR